MAKALVTGASNGIGRAIAIALHRAGHEVTAQGRNFAALADLDALGMNTLAWDMRDRSVLETKLDGQAPDILINNAGMMPPVGHFCDLPASELDDAITVNLWAPMALTRIVASGMRARRRGHIFFTGSTAGHAPFANMAAYAATKAGIGGFAQSLRLDLAPDSVRVTEIVAGRVETGLYRDVLSAEARAAMYAGHTAVQPQDVADMVMAVLNLPPHVDVARFDILPTHLATATGGTERK